MHASVAHKGSPRGGAAAGCCRGGGAYGLELSWMLAHDGTFRIGPAVAEGAERRRVVLGSSNGIGDGIAKAAARLAGGGWTWQEDDPRRRARYCRRILQAVPASESARRRGV